MIPSFNADLANEYLFSEKGGCCKTMTTISKSHFAREI